MCVQFLKKLNRQERVVEEVKLVLKPHYTRKRVSKDEYKDILRRAVPKVPPHPALYNTTIVRAQNSHSFDLDQSRQFIISL